MTSKLPHRSPATDAVESLEQFPVFPPRDDMQNFKYLYRQALPSALERHFGISDTTAIVCEAPSPGVPASARGCGFPTCWWPLG